MNTNKKSANSKQDQSTKPEISKRNSISSATKKVVTFNQTQISSQDNQSSEIHSRSSKPKSIKSNVSKKISEDAAASSKQKSISSQKATSQDRYSRKSSKDSKKSKDVASSSRRGKASGQGSKKGELDSRNVDLPSQNDEALNIVIVKNSQDGNSQHSVENAKDTINSYKGSVEMNKTLPQGFGLGLAEQEPFTVNPDLTDSKVDKIMNIPLVLNTLDEVTPEIQLQEKRAARKKQMGKRLDLIKKVEEQLRQASVEAPVEEPPANEKKLPQKAEEQQLSAKEFNQSSENQEQIIDEIQESENLQNQSEDIIEDEIELIKDHIEDEIADVKDKSNETEKADESGYDKDEFESEKEVLHMSAKSRETEREKQVLNAPTVSILKQPETSTSVQKQASIKSKKTVCISEDPNHKKKSEQQVRENSMDSQVEDSIISEEDSLFEDQTPAGRNANIDTSQLVFPNADEQTDKQRQRSKKKQNRSLAKTKSMNEEDTLNQDIVQRKDKTQRQQTLQNQQNSENKTPMRHHQDKSKGVLSQLDQESVNLGRPKAGTTYISSKPDPGSKFVKKQTTQTDEKRGRQKEKTQRGTQDIKGSNDNSLNLTVDNQMDHLSVNFGFRQKNINQSQDRDKEMKAGTNSMYSSQIDENQTYNRRNNAQGSQRKYQSNIRSASKGEGISFRSRDSIDQRSQSVGRDNQIFPYQTQKSVKISHNEDDEFDLRQEIQKANRKMVNIYLQKPYQVLSIQQIRQKDKGVSNHSPSRLYHAENMLKVHTQFRASDQSQKTTQRKGGASRARINESRQSKQGEKKSMSRDSRQSKVMVYNITWRSNNENQQEDYQPSDKGYDASGSAIKTEQTSREKTGKKTQAPKVNTNRQQAVTPIEDKKGDNSSYSYLSGSDAKLNYNSGVQPSSQQDTYPLSQGDRSNLEQVQEMIESQAYGSALGTERSNEKEFWSSLYNQLLQQLDRRIEVVQSQINFHSKTKNLCNIYGQKLDPIVFGNASYSPGLQKLEKMSPTKPKSKHLQKHQRHSNINAEFLQPLLAISKENLGERIQSPQQTSQQEIEQTIMNSQGSLNKVKMNKLNLQGLPEYNEQLTFEQKVKKSNSNMVTNGEEGIVQSPNQDKDAFDKTKILQAVGSGSTNLDQEFITEVKNGQYILSEEGGSRMEEYGRQQEPDLLKLLLQNTDKMGYSHQQLKSLKEKKEKLQRVEKTLVRQNQLKLASKAKNQSAEQVHFQQMQLKAGNSFDLNNREIKSFYQEPLPQDKLRKDLKKYNIHSNLQLNKQLYANKLNEHMIPRSNFFTQKLNSQQKPKNIQQSPANQDDAIQNEVETVEDYFGNKVSMRRSIELKLHYDPKGFRQSGHRNRNAIQQNIQSNDQVLVESKDFQAIHVSQINKKGYENIGRNSKSHATGKALGKTTNFIENNKTNLFPGQILSNLDRNRAALPNISNGKYKSRQSQKNNDYLKKMSYDHEMTVGVRNVDSNNLNSNNYNNMLTPQKEEKSPIRNQKSRFIEENQKQSKKRLIQSGHQVLGRSGHAQNSGINLDNGQNNILNHQFKNISPRLPNFKNSFQQKSQEPNYEESMFNIQFTSKNYQHNPMPNGNASSVISSQYGAASRFNSTKQSMILQGFLNQQRIFNRMINNAGIQQHRSNNASKLGMVQTGYSSNNEFSDLSNTQKHFGQNLRNSSMNQNMHEAAHDDEYLNEATPKSGDAQPVAQLPQTVINHSQNEAMARLGQTAQQVDGSLVDLDGQMPQPGQ